MNPCPMTTPSPLLGKERFQGVGWLQPRRPWRCSFGFHDWEWADPKPLWRCNMVDGVPRPYFQTARCRLCAHSEIRTRRIFDSALGDLDG